MNTFVASSTTRVLLWLLIAVLALVAVSFLMVHLHNAQQWDGGLVMFNHDLSDSVLGWMIAVPILIVVAIVVVAVLMGVAILVAGIVAMALVIALLAVVFALLMTVLPFALLLAVPVLIIWGIVKLVSPRIQPGHHAH